MRWRKRIKLLGFIGLLLIAGIIYWGYITNLNLLEWIGLLSIIGASLRGSMSILDNYYNMFPKMHKIEIEHTNDLISGVLEKKVVFGQVIYDNDEIHRTCAEWAETAPMFAHAVKHLTDTKYRHIWFSYLNGKQYDENISDKIYSKIQQYRNIIKIKIDNENPNLFGRNDNGIKKGQYNHKLINHLIFYDISIRFKNSSIKTLEIYPEITFEKDTYSIFWCDNPNIQGDIVAMGDLASITNLKNVIESIEVDKEVIDLVLEIDSLKLSLENNDGLKLFEAELIDIIKQLRDTKGVLAGECDRCP